MIGSRLGPYEITAKLGEGGMGEVYRARDTKLEREVAIKVLPAAFVQDEERLARFEREAKLLAQLHHPHIASIFGLEESGGIRALVMELVEGPTLAERMEQGALPLDETLSIARQIAEALEEAHEKGIVHRDLKPQNVKVTADGKVKVLDFGLAKAMEPVGSASGSAAASQLAASPTLTLGATLQGVILGTAAYMAPEQAKGFAVDKRADIWAFGVVLFEMLTGRRLFEGDSVPDTLARVLQRDVDFDALPASTPAAIRRLLRRCLERSAKNRLHDIADARIVVQEVLSGKDLEAPREVGEVPTARRRALAALGGALLVALGIGGGWWLARGADTGSTAQPLRLALVFPEELEIVSAVINPSGASIDFIARRRDDPERTLAFYRRPLGEEKAVVLAGTEGLTSAGVTPDGRSVVFVSPEPADPSSRRILRAPVDGSQPPVEIAPWDPAWTDWAPLTDDEVVVVVGANRLLRVGAEATAATEPVEIDVGRPGNFNLSDQPHLPDGRLFVQGETWSERGYQSFTAVVDPATGKGSVLLENAGRAAFVRPDRLLFSRGSTLLGAHFDPRAARIVGRPVALADGLRIGQTWEAGRFRLAANGTLAFPPGGLVGAQRNFVILDPETGRVEPWSAEARAFVFERPQPSPDGRSLYSVLANAAGTFEVWQVPRTGPAQPFVALPEADVVSPRISRDGTLLAIVRRARQPSDGIYLLPADRSGPPRELLREAETDVFSEPLAWSPDGTRLLFQRMERGALSIREVAIESAAAPRVVVAAPAWNGALSPDGSHLAFCSDVSGRGEVYVSDYDASRPVGDRTAVSRGGGGNPIWSPDGRTLYFNDRGTKILAVTMSADGLPAGEPRVVADRAELEAREEFNVLPDGRLLLLRRGPREDEIRYLSLILHFDRILAEQLP